MVVEIRTERRREEQDSEEPEEGDGSGGEGEMFRDIARGYALERVAASTRGAYEGAWRLWVKWREWRERLLARGDRVRDGDRRGVGGVHHVLLRGTGESGDDGRGQVSSRESLP